MELTANELEWPQVPPGRLLLQTVRSHDQYNTTICALDDRYRGIHRGRRVVFVNPEDLPALGFADAEMVDLHSQWSDGVDRHADGFRIVSLPIARGCAAAYFPEANPLIPLEKPGRPQRHVHVQVHVHVHGDRPRRSSTAIVLRLAPAAG